MIRVCAWNMCMQLLQVISIVVVGFLKETTSYSSCMSLRMLMDLRVAFLGKVMNEHSKHYDDSQHTLNALGFGPQQKVIFSYLLVFKMCKLHLVNHSP